MFKINLQNLDDRKSAILDLVRGLAAILVVIHHVKNNFMIGYNEVQTHNLYVSVFYFITGFGRESVIIFFVLSGFLISRSVFKAINEKRWSWMSYCVDRLTRLEVVLIPALFLTLFWDYLGHLLFNSLSDPQKLLGNFGSLDLKTFLGNLAFTQTILVPTFGSNYPLWSLSSEFWYYILFPLLLFAILPQKHGNRKYFYIVLLIGLLFLVKAKIALYFFIWLLGVLPTFLPQISQKVYSKLKPIIALILCFLVLTPLLLSRLHFSHYNSIKESYFIYDAFTASCFTLAIYIVINLPDKHKPKQNYFLSACYQFAKNLSGFSYTLYLVHQPLISFLALINKTLNPNGWKWQPSLDHFVYYTCVTTVVLAYAWLVASLTEAHTQKVRGYIRQMVLR